MSRPPPPSSPPGRLRLWWYRITGRGATPAPSAIQDHSLATGPTPVSGTRPVAIGTAGRWQRHRHTGRSGDRDYWLYLPPAAAGAATPLPLIVMLHGCRQTAEDFAVGTRMNRLGEADGFAVLYPEQSREQNPMGCWNWFLADHQQRGRGEPEIIAGLTRDVVAANGIDADRVYIAGLSAGGAMATIVGNEYPDIYAAIAVHSGLRQGAATSVAAALAVMRDGRERGSAASAVSRGGNASLPTIIFHGDDDATVHPANGAALYATFAEIPADGDSVVVDAEPGRHGCRRDLARAADGSVRAEFWRVTGGGHAWFGGDPRGSFTDANGPDASAEVVRFFRGQRRRAGDPAA